MLISKCGVRSLNSVGLSAMALWCLGQLALPAAETVTLTWMGQVSLDRSRFVGIPATGKDALVVWMAPDGTPVVMGDPLITFDAYRARAELIDRDLELETFRRQQELDELRRQRALADVQDEAARLVDDLRTAEAARAALDAAREATAALAQTEAEAAVLTVAEAQRAAVRARQLHALGQSDDPTRDQAEAALVQAQDSAIQAAAAASRAALPDDIAIKQADLRLTRLRREQDDGEGAITKRAAALRAAHARERSLAKADREKLEQQRHINERDGHDHTPWRRLTVWAADGATIAALQVALPGATVAAPLIADHGEAYTSARGWGWDRDLSARLRLGSDGALLLVRERAVWRQDLPDGIYRVRIELGDAVEWDGALLRAAGRCLFTARRIEAGARAEVDTTITVNHGRLELIVGDTLERTLRAPADGASMRQQWLKPGYKTWDEAWPVTYFVPGERLLVRLRVRQDEAALLRGGLPGAAPWAVNTVTIRTADGGLAQGRVQRVDDEPVPLSMAPLAWEDQDLERIANEITIEVGEGVRPRLGAPVEVLATVTAPAERRLLPGHLASARDGRVWVRPAGGALREVEAQRVGRFWLVSASAAGAMIDPGKPPLPAAAESWSGAVVAGRSALLTLPSSWGRIATMAPEGSAVQAGHVVVTLYNPALDARRDELARARRRGAEAYQLAGDQRQQKVVEAQRTATARALDATAARLAWAALLPLPWSTATARDQAVAARRQAATAAALAARFAPLAQGDPQRAAGYVLAARNAAGNANRADLQAAKADTEGDPWQRATLWQDWLDRALLAAGRDGDLRQVAEESRLAALRARLELQRALDGQMNARNFRMSRELKAPMDGRIFYATTWNDQSNRREKIGLDMVVWQGITVAEILDLTHPAFTARVPERLYPGLRVGLPMIVVLPQFGLRLPGTIRTVGRVFTTGIEAASTDRHLRLGNRSEVEVTVDFTAPAGLQDRLVPGTKGNLELGHD